MPTPPATCDQLTQQLDREIEATKAEVAATESALDARRAHLARLRLQRHDLVS